MTDLGLPGDDHDLERHLARLATDAVFPATPDFAMPHTAAPAEKRAPVLKTPAWWKVALAGSALLVAVTLAIPDTREAMADWLGFPGIQIEIGDRVGDPPPTVTSIGGSLLLGRATTFLEAEAMAGFDVVMPTAVLDGADPEVYLNSFQGAPVVSLLYPASKELPEIGETGVGLLLMQIDASGNTSMFITKRAVAETPPRPVTVDGGDGMWIQGGVLMIDAGDPFWTYQRRSGNVLVWERDRITYRMESNLPVDDAIAIAESLVPIKGAS